MKMYRTDLHIHTCLSPCAGLDMSPATIILEAKSKGIDITGICDHNSAENVPAVKKQAEMQGINTIGGIEITSKEEVHFLALFEDNNSLFRMQDMVYDHLSGTNDEKLFGDQVVVNAYDEVLAFNHRFLLGATDIPAKRLVQAIHDLGGLVFASHVDRTTFSIIHQLGFIPDDLELDGLEISNRDVLDLYKNLPFPLLTFSDAHRPGDIGSNVSFFYMEAVTINEIRKSLLGEEGRKVVL